MALPDKLYFPLSVTKKNQVGTIGKNITDGLSYLNKPYPRTIELKEWIQYLINNSLIDLTTNLLPWQNTLFVDPAGFTSVDILSPIKGDSHQMWASIYDSVQDATNATPMVDGDHIEIGKGDYTYTLVAGATTAESTLNKYTNSSFRLAPGSTVAITQAATITGLFSDADTQFDSSQDRHTKVDSFGSDWSIVSTSAPIPIMITMYNVDSTFIGKFGKLTGVNTGRQWLVQSACKYFDVEIDEVTGITGDLVASLGWRSKNSGGDVNKSDAYERLAINSVTWNQTYTTSGTAFRVQPGGVSDNTDSRIIFDIGSLIINGSGGGEAHIEAGLDNAGTTIRYNLGTIHNNSSGTGAYPGDYTVTGSGEYKGFTFGAGVINYESVVVDVDSWISNREFLSFFGSAGLDGTRFLFKVNKGRTVDHTCLRLGSALALTNGAQLIVEGDFATDAEACIQLYGISLDATSSILFRGRYETTGAGKSVVLIKSITGTGANNIIFENCTLINDGVAAAIGSDTAGQNIIIKNCFTNSTVVDGDVTELGGTMLKDANII